MDNIDIAETVKSAIRQAATNIEQNLSRLKRDPIVSFEAKDEIDDADQPITTLAEVSASAPPIPSDKIGMSPGLEIHVRFALHRKHPYVLVYAKNTNGMFPAGWVNAKVLSPEQATTEELTRAAEMALSAALAYEQIHEQT